MINDKITTLPLSAEQRIQKEVESKIWREFACASLRSMTPEETVKSVCDFADAMLEEAKKRERV